VVGDRETSNRQLSISFHISEFSRHQLIPVEQNNLKNYTQRYGTQILKTKQAATTESKALADSKAIRVDDPTSRPKSTPADEAYEELLSVAAGAFCKGGD
jgi:hypothetical protein